MCDEWGHGVLPGAQGRVIRVVRVVRVIRVIRLSRLIRLIRLIRVIREGYRMCEVRERMCLCVYMPGRGMSNTGDPNFHNYPNT